MTHLSNDLDRICKAWCPIVNQCEEGHYCKYMDKIRKMVVKISDFWMFSDDKDY